MYCFFLALAIIAKSCTGIFQVDRVASGEVSCDAVLIWERNAEEIGDKCGGRKDGPEKK